MKKRIRSLALALVLTLGLAAPAFAAGDPGIQVQLDGKNLEFTDAAPQVKDSRTFLPYRAVFEAMGAEVSNEGSVITAVRGDTTLAMTIGETTATLTTGGAAKTLTIDVAPYVDPATWRTYVPVRFAADAFGCNVGWDQQTQTAILVDVDKLTQGLLTGEDYSLLGKFLDYSRQFNQGSWTCEGSMEGKAGVLGSDVLTLDGSLSGLTADASTAEMTMGMNMDMTGLFTLLAALQGVTPEDLGMTADDMKMSADMVMKMDMTTGQYYFQYGDEIGAQLGLPAGTWLSMDLNAMMAQSGVDLDLNTLKALDLSALLKTSLAAYSLDGKSATGYNELVSAMNALAATLSDKGFQKSETGYSTTLTMAQNGATATIDLILTTGAKDNVTGYEVNVAVDVALPQELADQLTASGIQGADKLRLLLNTGVDAKNLCTVDMSLSLGQAFAMTVKADMAYAKTDKVPDVTLPEGAVVVDFATLLAGQQTPDQA